MLFAEIGLDTHGGRGTNGVAGLFTTHTQKKNIDMTIFEKVT